MSLNGEDVILEGFAHARTFESYPKLPPGYRWEDQIERYCPVFFYDKVSLDTKRRHNQHISEQQKRNEEMEETAKLRQKSGFSKFKLSSSSAPTQKASFQKVPAEQEPFHSKSWDSYGSVFCHRALYDRALKIPENSSVAIDNGVSQGLLLHELDARLGPGSGPNQTFLAHDERAGRVTAKDRRWSSLNVSDILETCLVTRRFDLGKMEFASSYQAADVNVTNLENLMSRYSKQSDTSKHCTFQIDLRGHDFPRAIAWYCQLKLQSPKIMLKGYNLTFPDGLTLRNAVEDISLREYKTKFQWQDLHRHNLPIIMVFYSQPILAQALKAKGFDPKTATLADRAGLSYEYLVSITQTQVISFLEIAGGKEIGSTPLLIPEIVSSGLGLGYDITKGVARDPLDGKLILDPEIILDSRLDRAMIEATLQLKKSHPWMLFSSCTRLCEIRLPEGQELTADMATGKLKTKPSGVKGISQRMRAIHGGLYPRSDIVVADDPFAEIAARTWIDEYAGLDRSKLLDPNITYDDWLLTAGPEVLRAVKKLQGPFLPNTFTIGTGYMDSNWNIVRTYP